MKQKLRVIFSSIAILIFENLVLIQSCGKVYSAIKELAFKREFFKR